MCIDYKARAESLRSGTRAVPAPYSPDHFRMAPELVTTDPWDFSSPPARTLAWDMLRNRPWEAQGDAVLTQRALVGRVRLWVKKAAAIGAGLNTVVAIQIVFLIHEDDAVWRHKRRADRTDLRTR